MFWTLLSRYAAGLLWGRKWGGTLVARSGFLAREKNPVRIPLSEPPNKNAAFNEKKSRRSAHSVKEEANGRRHYPRQQ